MTISVLAVEDSATMQKALAITLKSEGFQGTVVATLAHAIEALKSNPSVDVLLLDMTLPGTEPYSACASLRAIATDLPILFLVGRNNAFDEVRAAEVGSEGRVYKPFATEELLTQISKCAEHRKQRNYTSQGQQIAAQNTLNRPGWDESRGTLLQPARPKLLHVLKAITRLPTNAIEALGVRGINIKQGAVIWAGVEWRMSDGVTIRAAGRRTSVPLITSDPSEAWELLASNEAIPMDWVGSTNRQFWLEKPCPVCASTTVPGWSGACATCQGKRKVVSGTASPVTIEIAATLAADAPGVATVEELAREVLGDVLAVENAFLWRVLRYDEMAQATQTVRTRKRAIDESRRTRPLDAERAILELGYALGPFNKTTGQVELWVPALGATVVEYEPDQQTVAPQVCLSVAPRRPVTPATPQTPPLTPQTPPQTLPQTPPQTRPLTPPQATPRPCLSVPYTPPVPNRSPAPPPTSAAGDSGAIPQARSSSPNAINTPQGTASNSSPRVSTSRVPASSNTTNSTPTTNAAVAPASPRPAAPTPTRETIERAAWEIIPAMARDMILKVIRRLFDE